MRGSDCDGQTGLDKKRLMLDQGCPDFLRENASAWTATGKPSKMTPPATFHLRLTCMHAGLVCFEKIVRLFPPEALQKPPPLCKCTVARDLAGACWYLVMASASAICSCVVFRSDVCDLRSEGSCCLVSRRWRRGKPLLQPLTTRRKS